MEKLKNYFIFILVLAASIACDKGSEEKAKFTGPNAMCPPSPTQGFSDPICCIGSMVDGGIGMAMQMSGIPIPMPIPIGQLLQSKIPGIEKKCGESPVGSITRGLERVNDAVERAQEGSYNASRLLCESSGTCDSETGIDTKKETKLPQTLSSAITTDDGSEGDESSFGDGFIPGTLGGSGGGGGSNDSAGGKKGGSGSLGGFAKSKPSEEAQAGNGQKQEAYLAGQDSQGGKLSGGSKKRSGGGGGGASDPGKNGSGNPLAALLGGGSDKDDQAGRDLASLNFGEEGADNFSALGSQDPSDYFSRIDIYSSIFKIVERKYRQKQMNWKIQDSENIQ